jgi:hypothetical protein
LVDFYLADKRLFAERCCLYHAICSSFGRLVVTGLKILSASHLKVIRQLVFRSFFSGIFASIIIIPLSPLFKHFGLRIGHYGPKFAALFVDDAQPWMLFTQHLLIGWLSALPLLLILEATAAGRWPVRAGALYGFCYYMMINSLVLPLYFHDPTPWQIGWSTVYPSLIGHILFGTAVGVASALLSTRSGRISG